MNIPGVLILKRIQDGDIREYERLFREFYKPLCIYADSMVHDMNTAEDIVQEFFFNFWRNRASLRLRFSLKAYLYQSIRNNSLMYLRQLAVRDNFTRSIRQSSGYAEQGHEENLPELGELRSRIDHTLQLLPERTAAIFRMNRFDGMRYAEIAEKLSVSVKTVEADMGRALQAFRESLKEYRNASNQ